MGALASRPVAPWFALVVYVAYRRWFLSTKALNPSANIQPTAPSVEKSATSLLHAQHEPQRVAKEEVPEEYHLPEQQAAVFLQTIFEAFDTDKSGDLDLAEVKGLMQAFQPDDDTKHLSKKDRRHHKSQPRRKATQGQVDALFKVLDADGNGRVETQEFSDFFIALLKLRFSAYDIDSSGAIDKNEVNHFLDELLGKGKGMIQTLSGQRVKADAKTMEQKRQKYIQKINQDQDKRISQDEFVGFSLACLAEAIDEGAGQLPIGLRNLVDLQMSGKGKHRAEEIASIRGH